MIFIKKSFLLFMSFQRLSSLLLNILTAYIKCRGGNSIR